MSTPYRLLALLAWLLLAAQGCGSSEEADAGAAEQRAVEDVPVQSDDVEAAADESEHARVSVDSMPAAPAANSVKANAGGDHPGKRVYARCSACHLPNGQGVPGAFPPLGDNVASLAATGAGREYLAVTVKVGVMGALTVGDHQYNGVMPPQHPTLDAEQISNVLNYVMSELNGGEDAAAFVPFTSAEVLSAFSKHADVSPANILMLRKSAIEASSQ